MIVINADGLVAGRVASFAAKQALLGEEVRIINAEKAVISGRPERVFEDWLAKRSRGTPRSGPFIPRLPDRFLRRMVRGMLPYKKPRGREAYKRVLCYVGVPKEFENVEFVVVPNAEVSKLPTLNFVTVGSLCKSLGGRVL